TDAVKIDVVPAQEKLETKKPEITYKTPYSLYEMKTFKTKLAAPTIAQPKLDKLDHNFVKVGAGNYGNIYAEYFFNTLRDRNKAFAVQGLHHSGNGPEKNSGFSTNLIDIYGKTVLKK